MVDNALGHRIALALKRSGRSQAQIAEALGFSPQAVTKWKKGIIGLNTLTKLAAELDVASSDLIYEAHADTSDGLRTSPEATALSTTIREMDASGELTPAQSRLLLMLLESFRSNPRTDNTLDGAADNLT